MHELASCFCPYQLYPHDTLCTYGVKQLKLLGFSQRHLFGCSLMVDLKRLELSTSRMRTERSPKWFRYMHPKFLENSKNIRILRKPSDMSFLYKGTFSAAPQHGKVSFVFRLRFCGCNANAGQTRYLPAKNIMPASTNLAKNVVFCLPFCYTKIATMQQIPSCFYPTKDIY